MPLTSEGPSSFPSMARGGISYPLSYAGTFSSLFFFPGERYSQKGASRFAPFNSSLPLPSVGDLAPRSKAMKRSFPIDRSGFPPVLAMPPSLGYRSSALRSLCFKKIRLPPPPPRTQVNRAALLCPHQIGILVFLTSKDLFLAQRAASFSEPVLPPHALIGGIDFFPPNRDSYGEIPPPTPLHSVERLMIPPPSPWSRSVGLFHEVHLLVFSFVRSPPICQKQERVEKGSSGKVPYFFPNSSEPVDPL